MKTTYRVLAYALAAEVMVQTMAIAYALAGLNKWVEDDRGVLTKKVLDDKSAHFAGVGGFAVHGINGEMIIPMLTLVLLIVSFFAKVPSGTRRAAILVGLVVLEVVLGIVLGSIPFVAPLHVLNAFGILIMAFMAGYRTPKDLPAEVAG